MALVCACYSETAFAAQEDIIKGNLASLPVYFEANRGQTDSRVQYVARSGAMAAFLQKDRLTLSLQGKRVDLSVAGANTDPRLTPEGAREGVSNYYRGDMRVEGIRHYSRVRASSVLPGIDVVYYGTGRQIEYDFIVSPGANPSSIWVRFAGAGKPKVDRNGDLVVMAGGETLYQRKPRAWQQRNGEKRDVACRYTVRKGGEVGLVLGDYDRSAELVIDPVISYSTYLGGSSGTDRIKGVAVDASGSAYVVGSTSSLDFPTFSGAVRTPYASDVFASKFSANGTTLLYSTIVGGESDDEGAAIAIDASLNAYVTGTTTSRDFPGVGTSITTSQEVFVAKLGSAGAVSYVKVFGGSHSDLASSIAVNSLGEAFVVGQTYSPDFPATIYDATLNGRTDGFLAKLTASGQIAYAMYLGGDGNDSATAIALDSLGRPYIGGVTRSTDFPTAFTRTDADAFVMVLNSAGSAMLYSTRLGGTGVDALYALALDGNGNCYISGSTQSQDFPTTAGAFTTALPSTSPYYSGQAAVYVAKFDPTLAIKRYATYLGSNNVTGSEVTVGLAVDSLGQAYVVGSTGTTDFPTTPGALKRRLYDWDAFLAQLSTDGSTLVYSTLLGAQGPDMATGIGLDGQGGAYVVGHTSATRFPTTTGAFRSANPKSQDYIYYSTGFVTKINMSSPTMCTTTISPASAILPGSGGPVSFALTVPPGCPWEAIVESNFITLDGPGYGMGSATPITVTGKVAKNVDTSYPRPGTVRIGEASFTVTQDGGSCEPVLSTQSLTFDSAGGLRTITLTLPSTCSPWTVTSTSWWITSSTAASGNGSANITVFASPNSFGTRTATLSIAGKSVSVTQSGSNCTAQVTPASPNVPAQGGVLTANITTSAPSCAWAAFSGTPWIKVGANDAAGQGSRTFSLAYSPNPTLAVRTGQVLIADQVITIQQAAGPAGTVAGYTSTIVASHASPGLDGSALNPRGLAFDTSTGTLLIADVQGNRLRRLAADGSLTTVAGGGVSSSDNIAATSAQLSMYGGVAMDKATPGAILLTDASRIRRIAGGMITTVAGTTTGGFSGDGGAATAATLSSPMAVASASNGDVYIADSSNNRIRKISSGIITTAAGGTTGELSSPLGITLDNGGDVIVADTYNMRIRKLTQNGLVTIAGANTAYPLTANPHAVAVDPIGHLYFTEGNRVRKLGTDGVLSTLADGYEPAALATDPLGNLYVSTYFSGNVYKYTPTTSFCTYSLSTPATVQATGATASVNVTTTNGCGWTATSDVAWATTTSAASGTGTATITLQANAGLGSRTANVVIAGQTVQILQLGTGCNCVRTDDFNNDGRPDIIWQDSVSGWAQVWHLGGAAGTTAVSAANLTSSNTWRIVGVGDFNQDGRPDIVWQDPNTGAAQVWFLGGAQGNIITGSAVLSGGNSWRIRSVADFNLDGRPDIVWQDQSVGWAQIWFMGGTQGNVVTGAVNLTLSNPWRIVGSSDFNSDGRTDLIWQDQTTGATQIWYLGGAQGNAIVGAVGVVSSSTSRIAAVIDANGDGKPDIVWQQPSNGLSELWTMLGSTQGAPTFETAAFSGSNSWRIMGPR
jgi:hypothetical protein